jgi:hypothetical protein
MSESLLLHNPEWTAFEGEEPDDGFSVKDFPHLRFKMKQVQRAGKALRGIVSFSQDTAGQEVLEVFRIAHNWRDSHAYPMRRLRYELAGFLRRTGIPGYPPARLKSMASIRRKLQKSVGGLDQMQDLGGCRAIVPSMREVRALVACCQENSRHHLYDEDNYIERAKPDGYRCHHLKFKFIGRGNDDAFNGRRIEIQIRSRLQHSWATAVEAVGLFRGENLKGGEGSPQWLRLFRLMSAEFAMAEGCPEPSDIASRPDRVREVRELERELKAVSNLENLRQAVNYTERYYLDPRYRPTYYLIIYDKLTGAVAAEPFNDPSHGTQSFDRAELSAMRAEDERLSIALVEVDKVETLKSAYPNYFGDVQLFRKSLRDICKGKSAVEFVLKPQETVRPKPRVTPDLSWIGRHPRRWR